mgnify:FL=1
MDLEGEEAEEIRALMTELNRRQTKPGASAPSAVKRGEVFPSEAALVLTSAGPGVMRWGFSRPGGAGLVVNARIETAEERPMFRAAARCLVPAGHYFEWAHRGGEKIKYRIGVKNRPLYMAGLFRMENGAPVFAIQTQAPAPQIAFIHDRMPLILPQGARDAWLSGEPVEKARQAAILDVYFEREDGQTNLFPD